MYIIIYNFFRPIYFIICTIDKDNENVVIYAHHSVLVQVGEHLCVSTHAVLVEPRRRVCFPQAVDLAEALRVLVAVQPLVPQVLDRAAARVRVASALYKIIKQA